MAIIIQYVVQHKGVARLTTADKKEADAYDKMLDTSEQIGAMLTHCGCSLTESALEELSIALAKNKEAFSAILKGKSFADVKAELVP